MSPFKFPIPFSAYHNPYSIPYLLFSSMPPCYPHSRTEDTHRRMLLANLSRQTGDTTDNVYVACLGSSFYSLYQDPIFSIFLYINIFFDEVSTIFLIAEQDDILFMCFRTAINQSINTMTMRVLKHIS